MAPLVAEVSHEVALYDEQIDRVQHVLEKLQSDRQVLAQYLVRHKGLSAPIRKLPPQILISIFQYVCHGDFANVHPASILRAVCVKWFNITATSSALWARIVVDVPYTFTEWWSSSAEREEQEVPLRNGRLAASQAVALSRQEALDVTFICPRCPPGMSPLDVLGPSHKRWRRLTISEDVLPDLAPFDLSNLDELTLKRISPNRDSRRSLLSLANLTRLICVDAVPHVVLQPAFENLRHLEVRIGDGADPVSLANVLLCLAQMPHLTSLCLSLPDFVVEEEESSNDPSPVTLSSVKTFSWTSGRRGVACLDKLHIPSLSHLTLTGAVGTTTANAILSLLERSAAHVSELVLADLQTSEDLIHLLTSAVFTDLTRLSLGEMRGTPCLTSQVFLSLSGNNLARRICRKLNHVQVVWNAGELLDEKVVLDMIESRRYGKEKLESAALGMYGKEIDVEIEEAFRTLRTGGLNIYHLCI